MQSISLEKLPKEVVFYYRKNRAWGNLLSGIFMLGVWLPVVIYTEKYWYGVFSILGITSLWDYFYPGTNKLIVKDGYGWPWSLYDKTKPENKIKKVETIDTYTTISTAKNKYRIDHKDLSPEELTRLDLLKKWIAEQVSEDVK
jgi:hypothetical protein